MLTKKMLKAYIVKYRSKKDAHDRDIAYVQAKLFGALYLDISSMTHVVKSPKKKIQTDL